MTTQQFKEKYPEYSHLEGESLWNMMENTMLIEKRSDPKKYQLRWLFYRNKQNLTYGRNNYTASEMCDKCKKGVSHYLSFMNFGGDNKTVSVCPHCSQNMNTVPNTNLNHKLWKIYKKLEDSFWKILDYLHICRDTVGGRYDMFNDEYYFVKSTEYSSNWNFFKNNFRDRKWWEYIIIEKR